MVWSLVELLEDLGEYEYEVYAYLDNKIQAGDIEAAYDTLTGIHNVGQKKARLVLRDYVRHEELDDELATADYLYVFPIDTWVAQVTRQLDLVSSDAAESEMETREIIEALEDDVSPIAFNQDAWYLGTNAFDILTQNLAALTPTDTT